MTIFQAILLGIVQGLTEFLPVSSSAHLALVPFFLNWELDPSVVFPFDVLVQLGTLLAVIIYFWSDLISMLTGSIRAIRQRSLHNNPEARLAIRVIIASIPAGLAGLLLKDLVEASFHSPLVVGIFLGITALFLCLAEWLGKRLKTIDQINAKNALWIGLGQALAIFPGISRSGATISTAMLCNFKRADAARFSFLMSIPIMLAAGGLSSLDLLQMENLSSFLPAILTGTLVSAVVGYLSIRWLLGYLNKHSFRGFALYCIILGILTIVISILR